LSVGTSLPQPLGVICVSAGTTAGEALKKMTRVPAAFARPRAFSRSCS
jgi:hypothetical protein